MTSTPFTCGAKKPLERYQILRKEEIHLNRRYIINESVIELSWEVTPYSIRKGSRAFLIEIKRLFAATFINDKLVDATHRKRIKYARSANCFTFEWRTGKRRKIFSRMRGIQSLMFVYTSIHWKALLEMSFKFLSRVP